MSEIQPVHGVVLDIDGTLVASNDAHAHAWVEALAEAGFRIKFAQVRPLIGMGSDKLLPAVTGIDPEDAGAARLLDRRHRIFMERWLPTVRPFVHSRALVERIL